MEDRGGCCALLFTVLCVIHIRLIIWRVFHKEKTSKKQVKEAACIKGGVFSPLTSFALPIVKLSPLVTCSGGKAAFASPGKGVLSGLA